MNIFISELIVIIELISLLVIIDDKQFIYLILYIKIKYKY